MKALDREAIRVAARLIEGVGYAYQARRRPKIPKKTPRRNRRFLFLALQ
jgi:hypothetical protein